MNDKNRNIDDDEYALFKGLYRHKLTASRIIDAISDEGITALCRNRNGYYIDNLDEFFGKDDVIDVPTEMAQEVIAKFCVRSTERADVMVYQKHNLI